MYVSRPPIRDRKVLTFVLDGFSKKLCLPQAKLGWITVSGPGDEAAAALSALELISDAFLSAGTAANAANLCGKLRVAGENCVVVR